jgi:hypothetical protein
MECTRIEGLVRGLRDARFKVHIEHPGIFLYPETERVVLSQAQSIGFDIKTPSTKLKARILHQAVDDLRETIGYLTHEVPSRKRPHLFIKCVFENVDDLGFLRVAFERINNGGSFKGYFYLQPCIEVKSFLVSSLTQYALEAAKTGMLNGHFPSNVRLGSQLHKVYSFR